MTSNSASRNAKDFKVSFADSSLLDSNDAEHELAGRQSVARGVRNNGNGTTTGRLFERTITNVEAMRGGSSDDKKYRAWTKLGTVQGVFIPTTLNVLSILMFVRFSFVIGQAGISGTLLLLLVSAVMNLLTTLSISAISTNGTVRGGGAYYMISRSLGPEFGGSIGLVFYIGQILNSGLNLVAFCDVVLESFGKSSGGWVPEGSGNEFAYALVLAMVCTLICACGSSMFSKAGNFLFVLLTMAILSIPVSLFFVSPFLDSSFDAEYTGFRLETARRNWLPDFTAGAAGSDREDMETFQDMFSIFFPATAGIFAGAGMSGDLRAPSKSIPLGTLWSLGITFVLYLAVIVSVGGSASRELIYKDIQVIQHINVSEYVIMIGELSTCLYSALVGIIGAAKLLQAIARDNLLGWLDIFAQGSELADDPWVALGLTFLLTAATLLLDVNQIAVFITMAFLSTFVAINVACFLLKISSAPNFRPSFRYFSQWTAGLGAIMCLLAMFYSDGMSAMGMICVLVFLILIIHYLSPPKPWGDVSQTLIYHQVRKYLLRLKQDHVKYWRPQLLVLVDDPKRSWNLVHFCNHLKKGGLYILGHVVVTNNFHESFPEVTKQQAAWAKLRDMGHVKGFVQIAASTDVVWGTRNVYLGSGLGSMKPNITVIGFLRGNKASSSSSSSSSPTAIDMEPLPTDECRREPPITACEWVNILEDLITMHANIAVAKGFGNLQFPTEAAGSHESRFIDLYPIQISAQITDDESSKSVTTTNFDTYTLILQLGAILHTVSAWKKTHWLRVVAFVETTNEAQKEHERLTSLLAKLRINASVRVQVLQECEAYNIVINNKPDNTGVVTSKLENDEWWQTLQQARKDNEQTLPPDLLAQPQDTVLSRKDWDEVMDRRQQWYSAQLNNLGVNLNIQTNQLHQRDLYTVTGEPSSSTTPTSRAPSQAGSTQESSETTPLLGQDDSEEPGNVQSLRFNDIPANVQHVILNDLMKNTSKNAAVIFTTLPAPSMGTHESAEDSEAYVDSLETWCEGLPPMMLLHSQTMTVTTSL